MDYTPNIDAQGMRRPMGPVDQPNWNGEEHVEKAIISMRDIWSEASPELKRRMKTELSTLVDGMSI